MKTIYTVIVLVLFALSVVAGVVACASATAETTSTSQAGGTVVGTTAPAWPHEIPIGSGLESSATVPAPAVPPQALEF